LKSGLDAIDERARFELGMIKNGEIFVQVPQTTPQQVPPAVASAPSRNGLNATQPAR
ncbi:MAG: septum formation initiator family protein, partial [Rugosibacter sp.]|nr:septum formation initiator family protein [Rugosibacter sp.]